MVCQPPLNCPRMISSTLALSVLLVVARSVEGFPTPAAATSKVKCELRLSASSKSSESSLSRPPASSDDLSAPQSKVFLLDEDEVWESGIDSSNKEEGDAECYVDDLDQHGESCLVSDTDSSLPAIRISADADNIDVILKWVPLLSPITAFFTYEITAEIFDRVIEYLSDRTWIAVDGGQYQTEIITPAVNGIVVPAIALLFATLISNTINTLRQRQLDIRTALNMEACEMRTLHSVVDSFPKSITEQNSLREYLIQYASRLIAESKPGVKIIDLEFSGSIDSELNGFLGKLNEINVMSTSANGVNHDSSALPPSLLSECYAAITRLNSERSSRISALQSTFPRLHYVILSLLAASLCVAFLMETDQAIQIFLNAIQLRILWSMLVGTFSALAVVSYDLEDPFRGSYQISSTSRLGEGMELVCSCCRWVDDYFLPHRIWFSPQMSLPPLSFAVAQFHTIRDALRASATLDARKREEEKKGCRSTGIDSDDYDADATFG
jgi:hypothetical protein